jgi:hypothetical protein
MSFAGMKASSAAFSRALGISSSNNENNNNNNSNDEIFSYPPFSYEDPVLPSFGTASNTALPYHSPKSFEDQIADLIILDPRRFRGLFNLASNPVSIREAGLPGSGRIPVDSSDESIIIHALAVAKPPIIINCPTGINGISLLQFKKTVRQFRINKDSDNFAYTNELLDKSGIERAEAGDMYIHILDMLSNLCNEGGNNSAGGARRRLRSRRQRKNRKNTRRRRV